MLESRRLRLLEEFLDEVMALVVLGHDLCEVILCLEEHHVECLVVGKMTIFAELIGQLTPECWHVRRLLQLERAQHPRHLPRQMSEKHLRPCSCLFDGPRAHWRHRARHLPSHARHAALDTARRKVLLCLTNTPFGTLRRSVPPCIFDTGSHDTVPRKLPMRLPML